MESNLKSVDIKSGTVLEIGDLDSNEDKEFLFKEFQKLEKTFNIFGRASGIFGLFELLLEVGTNIISRWNFWGISEISDFLVIFFFPEQKND